MKKYKYTAINLEKKKFTGIFLAENEQELARKLADQRLYLVKAREVRATTANTFFTTSGKVKVSELATFCRQFAIMVTTGISIVSALDILRGQSYSTILKKTLDFVHEDVQSGMLLSAALEKHKKIFPRFFRSMIYIGEVSGSLDKILVTLADYLESDMRIRKKIKSAMMYPMFLIILAVGIVVLMMAFIIPTFMDALSSLEVEMPALTVLLSNMSDWFRAHWMTIALTALIIVAVFMIFIHTKKGKYLWHAFLYHAPLVKKINGSLITARFARSFGLLIEGGSDVVDALETVVVVLDNRYVEAKLRAAIADVRQGMSLAVALTAHKVFPTLILQMIAVGEQTGNLAETLTRSCGFFDSEAEESVTRITATIQPIILGFIGAIVGILFYAVYSPLLQIMNTFGAEA